MLGEKLVDRVYLPGQKNPIPLRPNSPELFLLAMARDEAHRFANRGRKQNRQAPPLRVDARLASPASARRPKNPSSRRSAPSRR